MVVGVGIFLALIIIMLLNFGKSELWDENEELLKEQVLSIDASIKEVKLTDITPFDWDIVYSFAPYTPKEVIVETVGYKWDRINETVNEGMSQLVFLNDGKVVCYLYGYPENNGYGIHFMKDDAMNGVSSITSTQDIIFFVEKSNGVINLKSD